MTGYAVQLAWRGLRRFPRITILSVLALALGMGATITAHTVTRLLAGNPVPSRAGELYAVRLAAPISSTPLGSLPAMLAKQAHRLPDVLTWLDVRQIEAARPKVPQTAVINTTALNIRMAAGSGGKPVASVPGLEVQNAFFRMFDVPLVAGRTWSHADDVNAAPVAVISQQLAGKLFGSASAVGKSFYINRKLFRVAGVSGRWHPQPHFYGLYECTYACAAEQVFIPVSTARTLRIRKYRTIAGNVQCAWDKGPSASRCPYLGFWALLPDATQRGNYANMLAHYADTQKGAGRLPQGGAAAFKVQSVSAYLNAHHVVPVSVRFSVWVAVVFLAVCLVNVAGLLLTRFMRSSRELGIRRALGATRRAIFAQCVLEAGLLGLVGGLLALPLVWGGLWLVAQQPTAYAKAVGMDWSVAPALLALAIIASLVVGIIPAWRASVVEPGLQVKEA